MVSRWLKAKIIARFISRSPREFWSPVTNAIRRWTVVQLVAEDGYFLLLIFFPSEGQEILHALYAVHDLGVQLGPEL